jgi:hypothetical protein
METKMKQTPTPLQVGGIMQASFGGDSFRRIDDINGLLVALVSDRNLRDTSIRDNAAERFVHAVNAHEPLIDLVEMLVDEIKRSGHEISPAFITVLQWAKGASQ